jgi:hypothetical protein
MDLSSLKDRLAKVESRLQLLIEHGTTRMVSRGSDQGPLRSSLIEAVQTSIRVDNLGRSIAADTYILVIAQVTADLLEDDPSISEELLQLLVEIGERSGSIFQAPPRIKISVDHSMEPGEVQILSHFGIENFTETNTFTVDPGNACNVPDSAFLIINGQQVYPLTHQVLNIGRRPDNHIVIDDPRVSRKHAQIRVINNRFAIYDLDSTGGTYVNKVKVDRCDLFPGDVISLAGVDLVYGQDAGFLSREVAGSTQPLMPFPDADV